MSNKNKGVNHANVKETGDVVSPNSPETPQQEQQTETPKTEETSAPETEEKQETPPPAEQVETFEQKLQAAKEKAGKLFQEATDLQQQAMEGNIEYDIVITKQKEAYIAGQAVKALLEQDKAAKALEQAEATRKARIAILDKYLEARIATVTANSNEALTLDEKNAVYQVEKDLRAEIEAALAGTAPKAEKKVIHLAEGVTGAAVERGAKAKAIIELFEAGRLAGKTDTVIAKEIQDIHGHARGTTHSVIRAYRIEKGEITE